MYVTICIYIYTHMHPYQALDVVLSLGSWPLHFASLALNDI